MHIPDGFLSGRVLAAAGAMAAAGVGTAVWGTRGMERRKVPLLGLSAAFIFTGQMLNFPVGGGTSGHLIGGVLAAVLLGPSAAVVVLTSVLVVQCFLFADGGLYALGANVLNMGVVDAVAGYYVYRAVRGAWGGRRGAVAAVAAGAWAGTVLAAVVCGGMLAMSGKAKIGVVLPVMAGVHAVIGVGEAVLTVLVVTTVWKTRGDTPTRDAHSAWEFAGYGLIVAAALALFVAPFASNAPDGLEHVAALMGLQVREVARQAPAGGYRLPGIRWERVATAAAGLAGTLVVFAVGVGVARAMARRPIDVAPAVEEAVSEAGS